MEFMKDRSTDLWVFNMTEAHESPQERYLEESGMVRFKSRSRPDDEEEKKEPEMGPRPKKIPKTAVQKQGGTTNLASILPSSPSTTFSALPKNKRKSK